MNSKEFVIWLKGFSQGVHHYNITPAQWDYLKEVLAEVKDDEPKTYVNPYGYWKDKWVSTSTQKQLLTETPKEEKNEN